MEVERRQLRHHLCWVMNELILDSHFWAIKIHDYIPDKHSWCLFFPRAWHGPKNIKSNNTSVWGRNAISVKINFTINLLSTVFTTISSGVYCDTSNLSFNTLLSPSSWINGELISDTFDCARERLLLLLLLEVVEL